MKARMGNDPSVIPPYREEGSDGDWKDYDDDEQAEDFQFSLNGATMAEVELVLNWLCEP